MLKQYYTIKFLNIIIVFHIITNIYLHANNFLFEW